MVDGTYMYVQWDCVLDGAYRCITVLLQSIRNCVRELEQDARNILISMETIHHCRPDDGK